MAKKQMTRPAAPRPADMRVCRIASLTIVNAMIFQQNLASRDERVPPLQRTIDSRHAAEVTDKAWTLVLDEIDYVPIFHLARDIVRDLTGHPDFDDALKQLARSALRITGRRAALRHDLMGRIYHRLLADAKYFGAFYTTIPAAALLLKLTLDPAKNDFDWSDPTQLAQLRISDLACGTGTLLKASLQTIVDNYVRACAASQKIPHLQEVHKIIVEKILWGFDVIPFAIHLAAAALAMHEPEVEFDEMNLYTLPLGGRETKLGSLDLFGDRLIPLQADLFGAPTGPGRVTGAGEVRDRVEVPRLDLCVMNPPFTRSVGGNLLFGHAPKAERRRMQTALKNMVRNRGIPASITAGLGSVFAALGNEKVNPGGYMSLVLPRALLSGVAWEETRRFIGAQYHVEYVITSHQTGSWNFSENTKLSECLLVARKLSQGEQPGPTKFANLSLKPVSSIEALTLAEMIRTRPGVSLDAQGTETLETGNRRYGELILSPPERVRVGYWGDEAAFAQTELCRTSHYLRNGQIYVPNVGSLGNISLTMIGTLGTVGPDRRDIHDGFQTSTAPTEYEAFWGHETDSVRAMDQDSNQYLAALPRARRGRNLRDANLLWSRAGRLLIAERLRLNTAYMVAVRLQRFVLSNTWWPVRVHDFEEVHSEEAEKILAVWMNSTFGILSMMSSRVDTEGAWVEIKKPILERILVVDPRHLTQEVRDMLVAVYDDLVETHFRQITDINVDATRAEIDERIMKALGFTNDLESLRRLLAAEPLFHAQ